MSFATISTDTSSLPDIHKYDNQISHYNIPSRFSVEAKGEMFQCLSKIILASNFDVQVKLMANNSISSITHDIQSGPNFYGLGNKIYADDILAEICDGLFKEKDQEKIDTIIYQTTEQLVNMQSGMCPSGRVIRLIMIYNFMFGVN